VGSSLALLTVPDHHKLKENNLFVHQQLPHPKFTTDGPQRTHLPPWPGLPGGPLVVVVLLLLLLQTLKKGQHRG
jgi:hypothetical protein